MEYSEEERGQKKALTVYEFQLQISEELESGQTQARGVAFTNEPVSEGEIVSFKGRDFLVAKVHGFGNQSEPALKIQRVFVKALP